MQNGSGTLLCYISESPVLPNEPVVGAISSVVFKTWTPADRPSPLAPGAARLTGCQREICTSGRSKRKTKQKHTIRQPEISKPASRLGGGLTDEKPRVRVRVRVNYINPKQINGWQCLKGCGKGLEIEVALESPNLKLWWFSFFPSSHWMSNWNSTAP